MVEALLFMGASARPHLTVHLASKAELWCDLTLLGQTTRANKQSNNEESILNLVQQRVQLTIGHTG